LIKRVGAWVQKASAQTDGAAVGPAGGHAWPYPYDTLAQLPELHPWHARCLEVIGTASVGIGYDLEGDDEGRDRDVLEALTEDSFSAFCAFGIFTLGAAGNAYLEVVRNAKNEIAELYWVPPQHIWVDKNGGFIYRVDGATGSHLAPFGAPDRGDEHEVVHLKTPFLRHRHYGLPRWVAIVRAIQLDNNAVDYNSNFFANSARPDFAIIIEGGEFTPEVEQQVANFLTNNFKGVANSHRTIYIPVPDPNVNVRFEKLSAEIREASFTRLRDCNRDEIIAAHGVPPRILGVMSAGQLGGGGEVAGQILVFDQVTLQPLREKLAKTLNKTIIADLGLPPISFQRIDATTGAEDAETLAKLVGAGIITPDEARGRAGYEPADDSPERENDNDGRGPVAALAKALADAS